MGSCQLSSESKTTDIDIHRKFQILLVSFSLNYTGDGLSADWGERGQTMVARLIIRLCVITGKQTDHPSTHELSR